LFLFLYDGSLRYLITIFTLHQAHQ